MAAAINNGQSATRGPSQLVTATAGAGTPRRGPGHHHLRQRHGRRHHHQRDGAGRRRHCRRAPACTPCATPAWPSGAGRLRRLGELGDAARLRQVASSATPSPSARPATRSPTSPRPTPGRRPLDLDHPGRLGHLRRRREQRRPHRLAAGPEGRAQGRARAAPLHAEPVPERASPGRRESRSTRPTRTPSCSQAGGGARRRGGLPEPGRPVLRFRFGRNTSSDPASTRTPTRR
jgi:hypothetical protein